MKMRGEIKLHHDPVCLLKNNFFLKSEFQESKFRESELFYDI
jgi:hypothetical protein